MHGGTVGQAGNLVGQAGFARSAKDKNAAAAQIRISFKYTGSWSTIGIDALDVPANQPTMNYGWLTADTEDAEYSRVVIHEFGHTLGLIHEHQHPEGGIPYDLEKVYTATVCSSMPGWARSVSCRPCQTM